jgi:hypothetical protein
LETNLHARRAKAADKSPGRNFGGITLPSGKRAFAVYEGGKVVERYAVKNHNPF